MPSSMHICASSTHWVTLTTTSIPPSLSKARLLSFASSAPMPADASFSYLSVHKTPSVYVPMSNVRDSSRENMESCEDSMLSESTSTLHLTSLSATGTPTQTHEETSNSATAPAVHLNAYALPPPNTQPRFIFMTPNAEYINEDTTDSESISDVGHRRQLPPPRIYFPESLMAYVPPFCSDLLPRDPDIKGVPRNYRAWIRAGRPRLEVDGATRHEAKSDFSSIGLPWHGSGNGDVESESEFSDGKTDDKDKRRRKKKLAARRNAIPTVPVERPKRMVRRLAEADGQLRMVPGSVIASSATAIIGALEKADTGSSRAQSLAQSSLPSSRAQSPIKRRKANKLVTGAERKAEADIKAEDEERDADGSEDDDVDADGELDPDAPILQDDKQSIIAITQNHEMEDANMTMPITVEMSGPNTANKALSESSSVTLVSADPLDGNTGDPCKNIKFAENKVAKAVFKSDKSTRKRKRPSKIDKGPKGGDKDAEADGLSPSKKARLSCLNGLRGHLPEVPPSPRTTRSAAIATPLTRLRNRSLRRANIKVENVSPESILSVSGHETEERGSEPDDDKDGTFAPGKQNEAYRSPRLEVSRTSKPKRRLSKTSSFVDSSQLPSSRPTRTKRRRESSPSGPFDAANSSGTEYKGNVGLTSIPISRPHHRTTQLTPLAVTIPMRTFEPPLPIVEGYPGFYRRYPLILQFDMSGDATETGSPSKKLNPYGDLEKFVLDGVPRELVPTHKRPLGNFNPPRDIRDLYTPRYTKGSGGKKLALCPICFEDPRRGGEGRQEWNHTKTSQHNYHMQYYHGISASRFQPFSPPIAHRIVQIPRPQSNEKPEILQGKCHNCKQWIALEGCKVGELKVKELFWWKHAACCHKDSKLPGESDVFIEDEAYRRLLAYEAEHGIDPEAVNFITPTRSTA